MIESGRMLIGLLVHLKKVREQGETVFCFAPLAQHTAARLCLAGSVKRGIEASSPKSPEAKPQNILQLDGKP